MTGDHQVIEAWRRIAHSGGQATIEMGRGTLRTLFDAMERRARVAEADADQLAEVVREVGNGYYVPHHARDAHARHEQAIAERAQ